MQHKERLEDILGLFALPIPHEDFRDPKKNIDLKTAVIQLVSNNLITKQDIQCLQTINKMSDEQVWQFFTETIWSGFINIISGHGITEPPWNISGTLPPPNKKRIIAMLRQLAHAIIYELKKLES